MQITIELGHALADLVNRHADWSRKTFGDNQVYGPLGPLLHLEEEVREAIKAIGQDGFREAMADCLLLLLDASRRGGTKVMQLLEAAQAKVKVNQQRQQKETCSE